MAEGPSAPAPSAIGRLEPPDPTPAIWLGFAAMAFANFMALLDVQIVAAATQKIQAAVGASRDEAAYVQNAYLLAEVIAIPLSGFLGRALGIRLLFVGGVIAFTIASALCACAWDLPSLVFFRVLQGFFSGALIPTTMAAMYMLFPQSKWHIAGPIIAVVSTMASTMGPTIGGTVADLFGWRWIFLINVVPGILIAVIVWRTIFLGKPDFALLKRMDVMGLAFMAVALAGLITVLKEGPKHSWFDDGGIFWLTIIAGASFVAFIWRTLKVPVPIVELRVFTNPNFVVGSALGVLLGVALYGSVFVQPMFLGEIRGYSPTQIGQTLFAQGMAMLICAPVVGRHVRDAADPRPYAAAGFALIAISCWMQGHLTAESSFWEFFWPQILRGAGFMTCFVAVMQPAMATLTTDLLHTGAGVFNTMRNLGGALGIALLTTLQNQQLALHRQELSAAADPSNPRVRQMIDGLTQRYAQMGLDQPETRALASYARMLDREALVMSFNTLFLTMAVALAFASAAVWLMRKPSPAAYLSESAAAD